MTNFVEKFREYWNGYKKYYGALPPEVDKLIDEMIRLHYCYIHTIRKMQFEVETAQAKALCDVLHFVVELASKFDIDIVGDSLVAKVDIVADRFMKGNRIYRFPFESPFKIEALSFNRMDWNAIYAVGEYLHPNVSMNGKVCAGDFAERGLEFNAKNFCDFVESLKTVNLDSAFEFVSDKIDVTKLEPIQTNWTSSSWE